jgi:hypothetical protein
VKVNSNTSAPHTGNQPHDLSVIVPLQLFASMFSRCNPSGKREKFLPQMLRFIDGIPTCILTLGNFVAEKGQICEGVLS